MKGRNYYLVSILVSAALLFTPGVAAAQSMTGGGMMGSGGTASSDSGDQKGQNVYNQLQSGKTTCAQLTDGDFDALGDFFMGRMMGSAHEAMDQYMTQELGSAGERQAHIAMGERLSGCNTNASYPSSAGNYAPMAWMGGSSNDWNMMGGYDDSTWTGTDSLLTVLLVLVSAAAVAVWLRPRARSTASPLDILKMRYAKGELTKREFEARRKDL